MSKSLGNLKNFFHILKYSIILSHAIFTDCILVRLRVT
jgi:hypothetical protein